MPLDPLDNPAPEPRRVGMDDRDPNDRVRWLLHQYALIDEKFRCGSFSAQSSINEEGGHKEGATEGYRADPGRHIVPE